MNQVLYSHEAAEAICEGEANAVSLVFGLAEGVFVFHPAGTQSFTGTLWDLVRIRWQDQVAV